MTSSYLTFFVSNLAWLYFNILPALYDHARLIVLSLPPPGSHHRRYHCSFSLFIFADIPVTGTQL